MPSCYTPITLKRNTDNGECIPCGKCPACLKKRVSQWSFRLIQQDKISIMSLFITLTYDTFHIPITNKGFMSLSKRDLQLFFKRIRKDKRNSGRKISYYACGEYGGKTKRPHYHAILFNAHPESISTCWQAGSIHVGMVSEASVGYTLKYIHKSPIKHHSNDDRQKEFALMSKGLGANYVMANRRWHLEWPSDRFYLTIPGGKKVSMPRYYKEKIYSPEMRKTLGQQQLIEMAKRNQIPDDFVKYERDKAEAIKAQFRKHKIQTQKNDKL